MNEKEQAIIHNIPEFLAHAITLERESVERYEDLADSMDVHNILAFIRRGVHGV